MSLKAKIIVADGKPNAVTVMYLETIQKIFKQCNYNCSYNLDINSIDKKKDILIFDECKVAFKYWIKGYKNIVIWMQGIVPEEALLKGYSKSRYYLNSLLEYFILKKAKFVFLVSNFMLSHYELKYKLLLEKKSFIMPCFNVNRISLDSFNVKKKYINNIFVYAGSLEKWQCFDRIALIYKSIEDRIPNTFFKVFTPQKEDAKRIIDKYKIKNYSIDYSKYTELNEKLRDAKFGFILRENTEVNYVATPTKLSTYIANGVIPIYSTSLKDFNSFNSKINLAIPFDLDDIDIGIQSIISFSKCQLDAKKIKLRCEEIFDTYYNQDKYIENGTRILAKVLN